MKTTVKAILINVENSRAVILDKVLKDFSSAGRTAYNQLLRKYNSGGYTQKDKNEIEKQIAEKSGFSVRYAKDLVQDAHERIMSQQELNKMYYENNRDKAAGIIGKVEKVIRTLGVEDKRFLDMFKADITDSLCGKAALGEVIGFHRYVKTLNLRVKNELKLISLYEKYRLRARKARYYKALIDNKELKPVIFGGKESFRQRCTGNISSKEWKDLRDCRIFSRGDITKNGNPNIRVIEKDKKVFLEIAVNNKKDETHYNKIMFELYLPQKLSKKTGCINGRDYKGMVIDNIREKVPLPYQVEVIRKRDKKGNMQYYCHITIEELVMQENTKEQDIISGQVMHNSENSYIKFDRNEYLNMITYRPPFITSRFGGVIGVDTNPDCFALTAVDKYGSYLWSKTISFPELLQGSTEQRAALISLKVKELCRIAIESGMSIVIEKLDFKDNEDFNSRFNRIRANFCYTKLLEALHRECLRRKIELLSVNAAMSSKAGLLKYMHRYDLKIHHAAAMVIARRGLGFHEKFTKRLKRVIKNVVIKKDKVNEQKGKTKDIVEKKNQEDLGKFHCKNEFAKFGILYKVVKAMYDKKYCNNTIEYKRRRYITKHWSSYMNKVI